MSLTGNSVLPYGRGFNYVAISAPFSVFVSLTFSAESIAPSTMFVFTVRDRRRDHSHGVRGLVIMLDRLVNRVWLFHRGSRHTASKEVLYI
jgi:hypothetical protein